MNKLKLAGFTLAEILVVMGVLSIAGVLVLAIFTNTLRGNNKSQIISQIKQNGQSVLETVDKTIRNADEVVCKANSLPDRMVVRNRSGGYIRYIFDIDSSKKTNGAIWQDNPIQNLSESLDTFKDRVCNDPNDPPVSRVILTDTRLQTGVSLISGLFKIDEAPNSKTTVTIQFALGPGVKAPPAVAGQVNAVTFQTTVELR